MKICKIEERTAPLLAELVTLWEASVKASHHFLSEQEITAIKPYVPQGLTHIPHLVVAFDENQRASAFMGVAGQKLEMLFVDPNLFGKGIGKKLMDYAVEEFNLNELTVNEQNPQAQGFYQHYGFVTYKRTELDEQGNPYPLLYMKLN